MEKIWADKWCAWLRDPANKQTKNKLHDGKAFCCLGGACIVAGLTSHPPSHLENGTGWNFGQDDNGYEHTGYLPPNVVKLFNMYSQTGQPQSNPDGSLFRIVIEGKGNFLSLSTANDAGVTFAEIADWIEANYERL